MGEGLYLAARVLMWLCFLALPFSPFLLMIEEPVLRFSLFGAAIGVELLLLFTGCSLKIFNHWREQKLEKILEREGFAPSLASSNKASPQAERHDELSKHRRSSSNNSLLQTENGIQGNGDAAAAAAEPSVRTPTIRFEGEKTEPNFNVSV